MAHHCLDLLPIGGLIFVTVPLSYPYHRDPIDTMFRPSLAELGRRQSPSPRFGSPISLAMQLELRCPLRTDHR